VGLGTWQVQRRAWKLDLIARVDQRVHAPALPAPGPAEWPRIDADGYEYLHVSLAGHYQYGKQVLVQASTDLGSGYWVLTPLQRADGTMVLVNRGFVPPDQRDHLQAAPTDADGRATVTGLLRISEPKGGFLRNNDPAAGRWYSRDVQAIAAAQGLSNVAPYFVDAAVPANPAGRTPEAAPGATADAAPGHAASAAAGSAPNSGPSAGASAGRDWPVPGLTVIAFHNSHLVYAITWYGMALMMAAAVWYAVRDERRLRRGGEGNKLRANGTREDPPRRR
jgi:surfeit locus 1 family protein